MKLLALDTNVYMHGKYFTELPWNDLVGEPVCLLVPLQVLSELDELKYSASTAALRERAKRVAAKILELLEASTGDATVRPNVVLRLESEAEEGGPPQSNQDNRILDCCARLGAAICTNDTGVVLKSKARKIDCFKLPDDWLEPQKPDPEKAELQMLRNRQPKLHVIATANGMPLVEGAIIKMIQPSVATQEAIRMRACQEAAEAEAARRRRIGDDDEPGDWLLDEVDTPGSSTWNREDSIAEAARMWRQEARQLRIMIEVRNDGTNVANDVRVTAEVDTPFEFVGEAPRLTYPKIIHASSQAMGSFVIQVPSDVGGGRLQLTVHCADQAKPTSRAINFRIESTPVGPFRS